MQHKKLIAKSAIALFLVLDRIAPNVLDRPLRRLGRWIDRYIARHKLGIVW